MKRMALLTILIMMAIFMSGCMSLVKYDGPYRGRVIDETTKQPIEGVVILGTWHLIHPNWGGEESEFYDAEEAKTDKDGMFKLKGQGLRVLSNMDSVRIFVFKAGYKYDQGSWWGFKHPVRADRYKWDKDVLIIPLKGLSLEERKKEFGPDIPSMPDEKMPLMKNEINRDRTECGLSTL